MQMIQLNGISMHYHVEGDPKGAPIVFANSLGSDFRIWDQLVALLPENLRIIRYDMRGHGLTSAPDGAYFMGDLVNDTATLLDHLGVKDCVFVGLSIGGMVAQGLAAERMDLVRALVLSNTAAKIGTTKTWQERIELVQQRGIQVLEADIMERWFTARWRRENPVTLEGWRHMLSRTPPKGYIGCCAAISETDLFDSTARLSLPTLAIAGAEDGSTPADLVRETADLIKGSQFHLIRRAAHIPCVEQPQEYAALITTFLKEITHV